MGWANLGAFFGAKGLFQCNKPAVTNTGQRSYRLRVVHSSAAPAGPRPLSRIYAVGQSIPPHPTLSPREREAHWPRGEKSTIW